MSPDELLLLAQSQRDVRDTRSVKVWGPALQDEVRFGRLKLLADIIAHPDQTTELRTFRYAHVLGPGLPEADIRVWQGRFEGHPLPMDLIALLLRINGVHLWADLDSGRALFGIAPLAEWKDAGSPDSRHLFAESPKHKLIVSYHQNGDGQMVLDTASSTYTWIDHEDILRPQLIGTTVASVLDWLWMRAAELRPSAAAAG